MPLVDRLYHWLAGAPAPDADRILDAALDTAEPAYAARILQTLRQRDNDYARACLVARLEMLEPQVRDELLADPQRACRAAALALLSPAPEARLHALSVLERYPSARMAYALPNALRDPSPRVRAAAGTVLRAMADGLLARDPAANCPPESPTTDLERTQLVRALDEALRVFDLHLRTEVLEACLWFARDLERPLWWKLNSPRSRAGHAVREHLEDWDGPRLAPFLLLALAQPAWRHTAARLLREGRGAEFQEALLRHRDLARRPDIAREIGSIRGANFAQRLQEAVPQLAPELRAALPEWVALAGTPVNEQVALLSAWALSEFDELADAAVQALAGLNAPAAVRALRNIAESVHPRAKLAQELLGRLPVRRPASAGREGPAPATGAGPVDALFRIVWEGCRSGSAELRDALTSLLREYAGLWDTHLRAALHSADPRDRLLALMVIDTVELAAALRSELPALCRDAVPAIRRFAEQIRSALSGQAEVPRPAPPPSPSSAVPQVAERLLALAQACQDPQAARWCQRAQTAVEPLLRRGRRPAEREGSG